MESHLQKAQRYRDQAAEMRALAAEEDDLEAKNSLISLAEMYDRLWAKALARASQAKK